MESSFRLFRFRGIQIGANWSWILVFAYLIWALANGVFPNSYPDLSRTTYLVMAVVSVILFFGALVLHELGHALRALKEGMEIDGITLWFFGGVARFKGMFPSAGAEFRIAIAGPAVTAVLLAIFYAATKLLTALSAPAQIVGVADYLTFINAILLGFNLVPALPLDGGRVLRSYLWHRQGNFTVATLSAAKAGRAFGAVLIGVGVLGLFTGANLDVLPIAILGWFLMQAAQAEASFARFRSALGDLTVGDLMTPDPETVDPQRSVHDFIEDLAHVRGHSTYPVVEDGHLAGIVSLRLAAKVPSAQRETTTVGEVMVGRDDVPTVDAGTGVVDAVTKIQTGPGRTVVMDGDRVVGILSGSDIARAIEIERVRGREPELKARTPWIVWIVVFGIIVAAAGFLYSPPIAVVGPGQSFDISRDIHISGIDTTRIHGKYMLTSVSVERPTGFGLAMAIIRSREIVPLSALGIPQGEEERYFAQQRRLFRETELLAAAAAARQAGLKVDIKGTGARVTRIVRGSPAEKRLKAGDVITAIDGKPVRLNEDIGRVVRSRPSGTRFVLTVDREGKRRQIAVRSRRGIIEGFPGIGIEVETRDFDIGLPFRVRFSEREIGGPSAGITYALAVYDMLEDADLARGRAIASTGEINLEGQVGPIGGIEEKAIAAERAGAEIFIVPEEEVEGARGSGLDVRGVSSLKEAETFLRSKG